MNGLNDGIDTGWDLAWVLLLPVLVLACGALFAAVMWLLQRWRSNATRDSHGEPDGRGGRRTGEQQ